MYWMREKSPVTQLQSPRVAKEVKTLLLEMVKKVPNEGEVSLNLETIGGATTKIKSTFQVAEVTRPLMSVSRLCEKGLICVFDEKGAKVQDQNGKVICTFVRQCGLYVAKLRLKRPDTFGRQVR